MYLVTFSLDHKQCEYNRDLLPMEQHFAAGQHDMGYVSAYPYTMQVQLGPQIRQKLV